MPSQVSLPEPTGRLADVLPSVLTALGGPDDVGEGGDLGLPSCRRAVVVLVDGLGAALLAARAGYAPTMAKLLDRTLECGFPSTTATSMGTFGTGMPAGGHGMFGYQVLDPDRQRTFNELNWEGGPDPVQWQPKPTALMRAAESGIATFQVGPGFFFGSGLTTAALRGARFRAADTLDQRIDATCTAIREAPRCLVYMYWGEVDKAGHVAGWRSQEWADEVGAVDLAVRQLIARVPADTAIVITADHGMIDVPFERRIDLGQPGLGAELAAGVRFSAGEARAPMMFCEPGQADAVVARWRERVGDDFDIRSREEAVAAGWFGAVDPAWLPRIGDLVAAARDDAAITDSRYQNQMLLSLRGLHGSRTPGETLIPLLVVPPRRG